MPAKYLITEEQKYLIDIGNDVTRKVKRIIPFPANIYDSYLQKQSYEPIVRCELMRKELDKASKEKKSLNRIRAVFARIYNAGNCGENSAVAFQYLRKKIPIGKDYFIIRCSYEIRDHSFCLVFKRGWTIDEAVVVDPWPPKQWACVFKHHYFFKYINEKFDALTFFLYYHKVFGVYIYKFIYADGKEYNKTNDKRFTSVEDKYSKLYNINLPDLAARDAIEGKVKYLCTEREKSTSEGFYQFCKNNGFYFIQNLNINDIEYEYISDAKYLREFIYKLDKIIGEFADWGYSWLQSVGQFTVGREGQGIKIIEHMNLFARRKEIVDCIIERCELIDNHNYSELIIVSSLLLYIPSDKRINSLYFLIKNTGVAYSFAKSPLEKLKSYYAFLLRNEKNPQVLNNRLVRWIKNLLYSEEKNPNNLMFYNPDLQNGDFYDCMINNFDSWVKNWNNNSKKHELRQYLLHLFENIKIVYKDAVLQSIEKTINATKKKYNLNLNFFSMTLFLAIFIGYTLFDGKTLIELFIETKDDTPESPFRKLITLWNTIRSFPEEQNKDILNTRKVINVSKKLVCEPVSKPIRGVGFIKNMWF